MKPDGTRKEKLSLPQGRARCPRVMGSGQRAAGVFTGRAAWGRASLISLHLVAVLLALAPEDRVAVQARVLSSLPDPAAPGPRLTVQAAG